MRDNAFVITFGDDGIIKSWQGDFEERVKCNKCSGKCVPAVNFQEKLIEEDDKLCENTVASVYDWNRGRLKDKSKFWLHDYCAIQIYICRKCLNAEVKWNQA
jgi:hypothetical protein